MLAVSRMLKRVFTEAQKEANRKRTKRWHVAAKEKEPEYEGEVEESYIIMTLSEACAVGNLFQVKEICGRPALQQSAASA